MRAQEFIFPLPEGPKKSHELTFCNLKRYSLQSWNENLAHPIVFFDAHRFEYGCQVNTGLVKQGRYPLLHLNYLTLKTFFQNPKNLKVDLMIKATTEILVALFHVIPRRRRIAIAQRNRVHTSLRSGK